MQILSNKDIINKFFSLYSKLGLYPNFSKLASCINLKYHSYRVISRIYHSHRVRKSTYNRIINGINKVIYPLHIEEEIHYIDTIDKIDLNKYPYCEICKKKCKTNIIPQCIISNIFDPIINPKIMNLIINTSRTYKNTNWR